MVRVCLESLKNHIQSYRPINDTVWFIFSIEGDIKEGIFKKYYGTYLLNVVSDVPKVKWFDG